MNAPYVEETSLGAWLRQQYGVTERFKSARQLSLAIPKPNGGSHGQNLIGGIVDRGSADAETLVAIARVLGVNPVKLFKLAGWLTDDDVEPPELTADEEDLVALFRNLPETQQLVLGGLRAQKAARR